MANVEPPPLFDEDENHSKDADNDDLFTSAQEVNMPFLLNQSLVVK